MIPPRSSSATNHPRIRRRRRHSPAADDHDPWSSVTDRAINPRGWPTRRRQGARAERSRQMTPASITRRARSPSGVLAGATVTRDRACACRRSGCAPARGARAARLPFRGMTSGGLGVGPGGLRGMGRGRPRRAAGWVPAFRQRRTTVVLGATDGRSGRRRRPGACGARASQRRTVPIGASHDPRS